ncbi:hypothetical protein ACFX19_027381 [Malus domestica]
MSINMFRRRTRTSRSKSSFRSLKLRSLSPTGTVPCSLESHPIVICIVAVPSCMKTTEHRSMGLHANINGRCSKNTTLGANGALHMIPRSYHFSETKSRMHCSLQT